MLKWRTSFLLVPVLWSSACVIDRPQDLSATAQDEWTRTYTLAPGGEVEIRSQRGTVDVQGVDGSTVDVRVERIARAATSEAAAEIVPRIGIKEEITPEKVVVRTEGLA